MQKKEHKTNHSVMLVTINQKSLNDGDLFSAQVQPDKKKIEVGVNETILTASIRNNISHLSACGGTGKCSTCRVEITEGLQNCSLRSDAERKLSDSFPFGKYKTSLPDHNKWTCCVQKASPRQEGFE